MNKENKKWEVEKASYQMPQIEVVEMSIESALLYVSGDYGTGGQAGKTLGEESGYDF